MSFILNPTVSRFFCLFKFIDNFKNWNSYMFSFFLQIIKDSKIFSFEYELNYCCHLKQSLEYFTNFLGSNWRLIKIKIKIRLNKEQNSFVYLENVFLILVNSYKWWFQSVLCCRTLFAFQHYKIIQIKNILLF